VGRVGQLLRTDWARRRTDWNPVRVAALHMDSLPQQVVVVVVAARHRGFVLEHHRDWIPSAETVPGWLHMDL
jgi:hypothetical protein